MGAKLSLSAATAITPFASPSGAPSTDVSGFATVLDYVALMNYDLWGPWSAVVGPNAPLDDSCAPKGRRAGSATSAIKAWSSAGMPLDQIVLGVPAYGHSFVVQAANAFAPKSKTVLANYPEFVEGAEQTGDNWSGEGGVDVCGVEQSGGGGTFWNFWGLVDGGFLDEEGQPKKGIAYGFDNCSQTVCVILFSFGS